MKPCTGGIFGILMKVSLIGNIALFRIETLGLIRAMHMKMLLPETVFEDPQECSFPGPASTILQRSIDCLVGCDETFNQIADVIKIPIN